MAPVGCIEVKTLKGGDFKTAFASSSEHDYARFWVDPPICGRGPDGDPIRLDQSEGWIDVKVNKEGLLEIRGAHGLVVTINTSNAFFVGLAEA